MFLIEVGYRCIGIYSMVFVVFVKGLGYWVNEGVKWEGVGGGVGIEVSLGVCLGVLDIVVLRF